MITIVPFQAEDQDAVRRLILAGLAEHWGTLDASKNPDLNDIRTSYANAIFLVAWYQDTIVGTGALVPHSNSIAEIVRMSVAVNMRRQGIGRMLLACLCHQAKRAGYNQVILETTETWRDVIAFYQQFGFQITHYHNDDVYFTLDLATQ